jgi:hypothetical protein
MKKSGFTEIQIISILSQHGQGKSSAKPWSEVKKNAQSLPD